VTGLEPFLYLNLLWQPKPLYFHAGRSVIMQVIVTFYQKKAAFFRKDFRRRFPDCPYVHVLAGCAVCVPITIALRLLQPLVSRLGLAFRSDCRAVSANPISQRGISLSAMVSCIRPKRETNASSCSASSGADASPRTQSASSRACIKSSPTINQMLSLTSNNVQRLQKSTQW